MSTTNKESIVAGTDNHPLMLEESELDSWKIRIQRYIHGKPNGKLIWNSIKNGPTPHPTTTDTTKEVKQQTQSKYVTIVKNSQDISNVIYVNLYTRLKSYRQHAMKILSKINQSSGNTDPLAYMAQATKTSSHTFSQQYSPSQYVAPQTHYAHSPQQSP
uniref:Uncharacterized protein n=1 Tax=Tanacetum cinerariifolium TaxID=118510 RepID=A0A6L2MET9_TANCI|nr:hypothetical protein [Tanacetum cinerariifolium]